jgi:hypothetical protein
LRSARDPQAAIAPQRQARRSSTPHAGQAGAGDGSQRKPALFGIDRLLLHVQQVAADVLR